ncbi:uncharacterized protein LOC119672606 [Teleopsis dalmanni]|uniref:uncharacterized protein LOC119672606 n=1 Tax=Teleopsis dalmanni TaxID=139649 RepID=UPI0018CF6528|nr:uncharacterized protein LOC119672606 [Teleopsis dalmanni]
MQNTSVYSVKCYSLFIEDKIEFFKPSCSEHFWVDLNSCPLTLTFTGRCRSKENGEFVDISVIASINKIDLTNTKLTVFLRPPIIYSNCLRYLQDVYNATYATIETSKEDVFHLKQHEELLNKFNVQYSDPVCCLNETVHEYNDIMNSFCDEERIQNFSPQNVEDCQFNNNMQDNEKVLSSTPLSTIRSVDMIQSLNEFSQVSPISSEISVLNPSTRKRQLFTESNTPLTKRITPKKRNLETENHENQRPRLKASSHNKETYLPSSKTKTQKPLTSKMQKQIETFPAVKSSKRKPLVPSLQDANKPLLKNLTHKDFKKFTEPQWNKFINEITEDNCPELYKFLYGIDNDIFSIEQKTNLMKMMLQIPDDDPESPNENVNILQDKCKMHVICAKYSSCKFKTILQRSYTNMIQYEQTQMVENDDNIPSTSGVNTGSSKNNVKKVARRKIDHETTNLENNKKPKVNH